MKEGKKYGVSQLDAPRFSATDVQELLNKIKSLETDLHFSQATIRELVEAMNKASVIVEEYANEATWGEFKTALSKATKQGRG